MQKNLLITNSQSLFLIDSMNNIIKIIFNKIIRKKFIKNFDKYCNSKKGHVLLYYKTESFAFGNLFSDRSHVNNQESYEIAKIFNELGFVVDIIDRTANLSDINKYIKEDKYVLFIGLGAGDSGRYFPDIAERLSGAIKVLYAMGPEPVLSDRITKDRHNYFRQRHPDIPVKDRRLINFVDTNRLYKNTDCIITIGNDFSYGSYLGLGKDIYKIYLGTYENLNFDIEEIQVKNPKKFLYFGGNGNITKGLDLVLEVFEKNPELELYVGAPYTEKDFNVFSEPIFKKCANIHNLGFVDVSSQLFHDITAQCGYVILPSSSEGCATSVTTCMRKGLIPVVTNEAGIDIGDFGFLVKEGTVESVQSAVSEASNIPRNDFERRVSSTYQESERYTIKNFKETFRDAILSILKNKGFLV
jgi:hypothetical protein